MKKIIICLCAFVLALYAKDPSSNPPDVQSYSGLEDVFLETSNIGEPKKPAMLVFAMNGCPYCEQLKQSIKDNPDLKAKIINNFSPYYVNMSYKKEHQLHFFNQTLSTAELARQYQAFVTPTLVFLSPEGKTLFVYLGFMPKERMMLTLDYLAKESTWQASEAEISNQLRKRYQEG